MATKEIKFFVKRMNYKFEFPEIWDLKFIKVHNCIITSSVVVDKNLIVQIGKFRDIQTKKLSSWILLSALGILWGSSFLSVKYAIITFDPLINSSEEPAGIGAFLKR